MPITHPNASEAITAALSQNWKEAVKINTAILKREPTSVDALNRLGHAYVKTGQLSLAKKTFTKVLAVDEYNQIAQKNLAKLTSIRAKSLVGEQAATALSPMAFLEEPGITKLVECIHLAPANVLATVSAGQQVVLKAKNHEVEVRMGSKTYLGALPDDLSFKLIKLTAAGNTYIALVKTVDKNSLTVLLRELSRGRKFAKQPSFISTTSYVPFARGVTPQEGPDMTPTGEEEAGLRDDQGE